MSSYLWISPNYAEYLPERRKMMQKWADYINKLKKEAASASTEKPEPIAVIQGHGPFGWATIPRKEAASSPTAPYNCR